MTHPVPNTAPDDRLGIVGVAVARERFGMIANRGDLIEPTKMDCAYAAGFFDGEGCINIGRVVAKELREPSYVLNLIVGQAAPGPLTFLQNRWGGSIGYRDLKPPRRGSYVWQCGANKAAEFLLDIVPYLTVKYEQAALAMKFQSVKHGRGRRNGRDVPLLRQCFEQMRILNTLGRPMA